MIYDITNTNVIYLGRQGENLARTVEIDVNSILGKWPNATISLLVQRNQEYTFYLPDVVIENGILKWTISNADTEFAGDGKAEIRATQDDVIVKSAMMNTHVSDSLGGTETDIPDPAQTWADTIIAASEQAKQSAEDALASELAAKEAAESITGLESNIKTAEAARVEAEKGRAMAESDRVAAEEMREGAEEARVEAENERISAENERIDAEIARSNAETSRAFAEHERQTAEMTRVNAEVGRVEAEAERVEAEKERISAENERESAESSRGTAESERVAAESERMAAENERVTAETARSNAETSRASAEQERQTAEGTRVSAETSRETAENNRVAAETARVTAEQSRASAETARESAETDRQTTFETNEAQRQAAFETAESARESAEAQRVTAEDARATEFAGFSGEITQLKDDLANKLPKSPADWEVWTAQEQAAAREMIKAGSAWGMDLPLLKTITLEEAVSSIDILSSEEGITLQEFSVFLFATAAGDDGVDFSGYLCLISNNGSQYWGYSNGYIKKTVNAYKIWHTKIYDNKFAVTDIIAGWSGKSSDIAYDMYQGLFDATKTQYSAVTSINRAYQINNLELFLSGASASGAVIPRGSMIFLFGR